MKLADFPVNGEFALAENDDFDVVAASFGFADLGAESPLLVFEAAQMQAVQCAKHGSFVWWSPLPAAALAPTMRAAAGHRLPSPDRARDCVARASMAGKLTRCSNHSGCSWIGSEAAVPAG